MSHPSGTAVDVGGFWGFEEQPARSMASTVLDSEPATSCACIGAPCVRQLIQRHPGNDMFDSVKWIRLVASHAAMLAVDGTGRRPDSGAGEVGTMAGQAVIMRWPGKCMCGSTYPEQEWCGRLARLRGDRTV